MRLISCCPGFESQAHQLCFDQFIELCNVEKTKIKQKEAPGLALFKVENKQKEIRSLLSQHQPQRQGLKIIKII